MDPRSTDPHAASPAIPAQGPQAHGNQPPPAGGRPDRGAGTLEQVRRGAAGGQGLLTDEVSAEIEAAMADMQDAGAAAPSRRSGPPGERTPGIRGPRVVQSGREHRPGVVVSVGPSDIFIEFGPKELGVVPRAQFPDAEIPAVGARIEVVVDRFEPNESLFLCSRPGAVQKAAWELLEVGQIVEARVVGVNKGGLELEVAQHRAFMPASQASLDRINDLSVLIGEKFPCRIAQIDRRGRGNIVLSRRDLLEQERRERAEKLKDTLAEGQVVEGTVRKIMPFGAFVDLGGIDGLLHVSDITYDRVGPGEKNVQKYVKEGDRVTVKILRLDLEEKRISLGLKQLQSDPFANATASIVEGAELTGRVTRLVEFGAFVELAPGVEGLLHISELAHRRVGSASEIVKQDEIVRVRVLKVDPSSRRVSLSMKALTPAPPPQPGSREARQAERDAAAQARLAEITKETPALRRMREKMKGRELRGGF